MPDYGSGNSIVILGARSVGALGKGFFLPFFASPHTVLVSTAYVRNDATVRDDFWNSLRKIKL